MANVAVRACFVGVMAVASGCSLDWDERPPEENADAGSQDGADDAGPALDASDDAGAMKMPDAGCEGVACARCEGPEDCSAATPVCDTEAGTCRGCESEAECGAGNVCIEATGACVAGGDVAFVTQMGNDAGDCSRAAPCASLPYALAQRGEREVIHVLGGSLAIEPLTLTGNTNLVLDGEDTMLATSGTALTAQEAPRLTVEGFRFTAPALENTPAILVQNGSSVRLHQIDIAGEGSLAVHTGFNSTVALTRSHIGSLAASTSMSVTCADGRLRVSESVLESTVVGDFAGRCELTVSRNRFESAFDGSVHLSSGLLVMENNLIVHRDGFNDSISVSTLEAGSTIRFNTIANTTALASDGRALNCDASVVVTSNVFAYYSAHPIGGTGCAPRYSSFDSESVTSAGTGNQVADIETLFVDRSAGDFHLSAGSIARGGAEPGLTMVKIDLEGTPRPSPAGSAADSGAFEAP